MFVVKSHIYSDPKLVLEDARDLADTERKKQFIGLNEHGYFITKQMPKRMMASIAPKRMPPKEAKSKTHKWSHLKEKEIQYIKDNWLNMSARKIARELDRSERAVRDNAKKMGLKCSRLKNGRELSRLRSLKWAQREESQPRS